MANKDKLVVIQKKKSSLELFQEADKSLSKSIRTFVDFVNSPPALTKENKLAVISGLFAPQWIRGVTYNEIRIALVRACWEKMCLYPHKNIAIRRAINDLAKIVLHAQKSSNAQLLFNLSKIGYELTKNETPLIDPYQAQTLLRSSDWGINKSIALVLAKPGKWQKMSTPQKCKNGHLYHLTKHKRIWR